MVDGLVDVSWPVLDGAVASQLPVGHMCDRLHMCTAGAHRDRSLFVHVGEYSVAKRALDRELSMDMSRGRAVCAVPSRIRGHFISKFDRNRPIPPHFSLMPSEI